MLIFILTKGEYGHHTARSPGRHSVPSIVYLTNKKSGKVYAYASEKVYDESTGGYRYRRRCLGHVDPETGEIVENRAKASQYRPHTISVGTDLYLSHISGRCGLTSALKVAFPKKWELILSCAMYIISESAPMCMMDSWASRNRLPFAGAIGASELESLLAELDEESEDSFMKIWYKKASGRNIAVLHTGYTEFSNLFSLGTIIDPVRMHAFFAEMDIVFDRETKIPLAYGHYKLPTRHLWEMEKPLQSLEWMDFDDALFVVGRANSTEGSLSLALKSRKNFVIVAPNDSTYARKVIKEGKASILDLSNYYSDQSGMRGFVKRIDMNESIGKYIAYLFYSEMEAERDMGLFLTLIDMCRQELNHGDTLESHAPMYSRFFDINGAKQSGRFELRSDQILNFGVTAGYDVIVTDSIRDPMEALSWSLMLKDASAFFSGLKNDKDVRILRLSVRHNSDTRIFLQFIAFILYSEIVRDLRDGNLLRDFSAQSAVREMAGLVGVSLPGSKNMRMTEANYRQSILMKNSGIEYRDR